MKRAIAIGLLAVAVVVVLVVASGASNGGDGDGYRVRAIFDNATWIIPGEQIKIAGVVAGAIEDVDVTRDKKAAIVMRIDNSEFHNFRKDAHCQIRPQSLIGEKFVDCEPTQPRPPGQQPPPFLRQITAGAGKGQYYLPVTNTAAPVDIDLVSNVNRLPYNQRLMIIINEFGTALAGNGAELHRVIGRADTGLYELDKLLNLLANQNQVLADLTRDSDIAVAPLAREREHFAGFFDKAGALAQATAERRTALAKNFQKLPTFLREFTPTMQRLGSFSDEAAPVFENLNAQASNINRFLEALGPFSDATLPALRTLGDAADQGRPAFKTIDPLVGDLNTFATTWKPVAKNLSGLLVGIQNESAIENFMNFVLYATTSANEFDKQGHYLRAGLALTTCVKYRVTIDPNCDASTGGARQTADILENAGISSASQPAAAAAGAQQPVTSAESRTSSSDALKLPALVLPGGVSSAGSSTAPKTAEDGSAGTAPGGEAATAMLDYLLGSGS